MSGQPIKVEVKNPKEMEKGVFTNSYIVYEVVTSPMNWSVSRRYSDFDWLRKTLVKMYPGFSKYFYN